MIRLFLTCAFLLHFVLLSLPAMAAPNVVVSIKPVHSLVSGVMQGVGEPELLLEGFDSPHTYQLKPADAGALASADLIVWVGMELEGFLQKPIHQLAHKAIVMTLLDEPGMMVLRSRSARHEHGADQHNGLRFLARDPHLWLDTSNAIQIARLTRDKLIQLDPANENRYASNASMVIASLRGLEQELNRSIDPVRDLKMIAFHDTWQYLEKQFALNITRHVVSDPGRIPGARQVATLDELFKRQGVDCLLAEPQFKPHFLTNLLREHPVRVVELDPLASGIPAGVDAYARMIQHIGQTLQQCLPR
jgi:zinc transport system substrate-binding protein